MKTDLSPARRGSPHGIRIELVIIVGGLVATAHSAMMIVIPAMPAFISLIGGSALALGASFSAQSIGRVITNIPAGALAEHLGHKRVIIAGGIGIAVFSTLSGLASNVPVFLIFRLFIGIFSATTIVVANVVAAEISTVDNRGRVLGMMHGVQLVVGIASPGIGGIIAEFVGLRVPFYVSGILVLVFAIWAVVRLPETRSERVPIGTDDPEERPLGSRDGFRLLRDSSFFVACVIGFSTFYLRGGATATLIPLFADEILLLSPAIIGVLFMGSSALHGFLVYPAGAMADRYGRKIVVVPAGLIVGVALVFLPMTSTIGTFCIAFFVLHFAQGWGGQAPVAYVADLAPQGTRGVAIGLYRTAGDIAGFLGPLVSTALVAISFEAAFWSGALIWTITIIAFAYIAQETAGPRRKRGPVELRT